MTVSVTDSMERIRAPRGNRQAVIVPDRNSIPALIETNRSRMASPRTAPWIQELRQQTRAELLPIAISHVASYLNNTIPIGNANTSDAAWIVGGHQPELFHPGVWFKNVLIDSLAKETGGVGLHAIVDHDLARATAIKVPGREAPNQPLRVHTIPLPIAPTQPNPLPWNALRLDPTSITTTASDIQRRLQSVGVENPIAHQFFRDLRALPPELDVATAFSRVRHAVEVRHGLRNLELPISRLCHTQAWHTFLQHCIVHSESLHTVYNQCLHAYRKSEKISNPTQPVPPLSVRGEWIELPFWMQFPGDLTRKRVWVRRSGRDWQISGNPSNIDPSNIDNASIIVWRSDAALSARDWPTILRDGVRILPRALMTTLFLRTFVADVFVHGIGGGLYDRLTDAILEQFLGIEPPAYVTCTATLWLDMQNPSTVKAETWELQHARLERERQRLRSRPELYLDESVPEEHELKSLHEAMLTAIPPRGMKKAWHQQLGQLKRRIAEQIAPSLRDWSTRSAAHQSLEYELRTVQSREYSFVLFEEQSLMAQLAQLAHGHLATSK